MSMFGNTTNSTRTPFTFNTTGSASASAFGNTSSSTHNLFAANTTGNASLFTFGNTTNSIQNPFTFGNTTNSIQNPFSVNTTGNSSASVFGNPNNSTANPFGLSTSGNATSSGVFGKPSSSLVTSSSRFGNTAGPTGTPVSAGLTNHVSGNVFGFGPFGNASASGSQSTGSIFGQSSKAILGTGSHISPLSPSNFGNSTFAGTNTSVPNAAPSPFAPTPAPLQWTPDSGSNLQFSFGVPLAPPSQDKGSRIRPYAVTESKSEENCKLHSITCMPIYESKCHEELRWEDYELKSRGTSEPQNPFTTASTGSSSSSSIFPHFPSSASVLPWNITSSTASTQNHFLQSPSSLLNSNPSNITTPAFNQPSPLFPKPMSFPSLAPSTTVAPSNTTTPSFNIPSLQNIFSTNSASSSNLTPSSTTAPAFTLTPSSKSTPSTAITSVFNQPSSSFLNTFSLSPTLLPNPTSVTTTPTSNSPSFLNPLSVNPAPPSTITSSSTITWPSTNPLLTPTLTGIGNNQINPTSSTWAAHTSTGNTGGSTDKMVDCIVAVKDPFGSQSVTSHPSVTPPTCSPLIRTGISNMPVIDKPATTRISSLVTPRRISSRPLTVHARKYHPKSDEPKVPFFDKTNETQKTQKPTSIIPRDNPRSVFESTSTLSGVSSSNDEVTDASASLHEDGGRKAQKDQASSSTAQVNSSVPKLDRSDYYTQPSIQELRSAERSNPGFCSQVKDFVVGRHGYGCVKFDGETDICGLDLDALVYFNKLEVVVYNDEDDEKPEVGEGLNKGAMVTLLNVKCTDKTGKQYSHGKMVDKFVEKLKAAAENQGAEFVSYDAVNGIWKFRVKHFSRYGIFSEYAE